MMFGEPVNEKDLFLLPQHPSREVVSKNAISSSIDYACNHKNEKQKRK